jgi:RNA polymerase sigma-70 factor (ECF subfamily)
MPTLPRSDAWSMRSSPLRGGDFDALVALLDPKVLLRSDGGAARPEASGQVCGALSVACRALMFAHLAATIHPVLVNGAAGVVIARAGQVISAVSFTIRGGLIVEIDAIADPARLGQIDVADFGG